MAIVIKPPLFPRHPCREAIPLHMVCQDLYSVFKVLSFGTIILYQTFSDLSRGLLKIFLGNFYQSLNLKEVCIIVVLVEGLEPSILFRQSGLSGLWMPVPTHQHIMVRLLGVEPRRINGRFWICSVYQFQHRRIIKFLFTNAEIRTNKERNIRFSNHHYIRDGRSGRSRTYDVSNVGLLQSLAIATMHTDRYNLLLDY